MVPRSNLADHQRLSKIATLRLAIHYISALLDILKASGGLSRPLLDHTPRPVRKGGNPRRKLHNAQPPARSPAVLHRAFRKRATPEDLSKQFVWFEISCIVSLNSSRRIILPISVRRVSKVTVIRCATAHDRIREISATFGQTDFCPL